LLENISSTVIEELNNCLIFTHRSRLIRHGSLLPGTPSYTSAQSSCDLPDFIKELKQVQAKYKNQNYLIDGPINNRIMDLQWFYEDRKNFVSFANML